MFGIRSAFRDIRNRNLIRLMFHCHVSPTPTNPSFSLPSPNQLRECLVSDHGKKYFPPKAKAMKGGRKSFLLKLLVFLFALNLFSLIFFYFTSHHHNPTSSETHPFPTQTRKSLVQNNHYLQELKPWPVLPSYLPWRSGVVVKYRSCEGYFGNGFGHKIDVLQPQSGGGGDGWFRCLYSETLESSICEGGRVRMDPGRIRMAKGGERIEDVIGRGEEVELPVFEDGAFGVDGGVGVKKDENGSGRRLVAEEFLDRYLPEGVIEKHTMRSLMGSIRLVGSKEFECSEWIEEPTLLVTRFEYANLFHTFTDWYSAYVSSRVTGLPNRPNLVFVDGHCKTQLEETWRSLFSSLRYAKNFSGSVCFRHAIFSPLGYETPLFKGLSEPIGCDGAPAHELWQNPDDSKTARLSEFGEMIRAAYGFPVDRNRAPKSASGHNILFVRREDYLAHPRHGGKVQSRLSNEQEVFDALQSWVANYTNCKLNLVSGLFAHMPLKEQVRAIQDASVIVGAHGAGLTYIISALPKTVILEIISAEYRRPHFELIAKWKGLEYHAINLLGSYAETAVVVRELSNIVSNLGC